jgi:hypothetical protein
VLAYNRPNDENIFKTDNFQRVPIASHVVVDSILFSNDIFYLERKKKENNNNDWIPQSADSSRGRERRTPKRGERTSPAAIGDGRW